MDNEPHEADMDAYLKLMSEADKLANAQDYAHAVRVFTEAMEANAETNPALIGRANCYLALGETELALKDAEKTLKDDGKFHLGLLAKGEALYQKGDFEYALIFFHRGRKIRPQENGFEVGISKCQVAIKNSVGDADACNLVSNEKTLKHFKIDNGQLKSKIKQKESRRQALSAQGKMTTKKEQRSVRQLLGELYADKEYLEELMANTDFVSKANPKVKETIASGLSYLEKRTDFWRQERPMFARKRDWKRQPFNKGKFSGTTKYPDVNRFVMDSLQAIDDDLSAANPRDAIVKVERFLREFKKIEMPDKSQALGHAYSSKGDAYFQLQDFTQSLKWHTKDLTISQQNRNQDSLSRAFGNLGRVHALIGSAAGADASVKASNFKKAVEFWGQKLPICDSNLEKAWLFHEIGRVHLELDSLDDALENATMAIDAAKMAEDDGSVEDARWRLNATVLKGQTHKKMGDLQQAKEQFDDAAVIARELNDDGAISAIESALEVVTSEMTEGGEYADGGAAVAAAEGEERGDDSEEPVDEAS